jgi:hypothetical protein
MPARTSRHRPFVPLLKKRRGPSVTTVLKRGMSTSPALCMWGNSAARRATAISSGRGEFPGKPRSFAFLRRDHAIDHCSERVGSLLCGVQAPCSAVVKRLLADATWLRPASRSAQHSAAIARYAASAGYTALLQISPAHCVSVDAISGVVPAATRTSPPPLLPPSTTAMVSASARATTSRSGMRSCVAVHSAVSPIRKSPSRHAETGNRPDPRSPSAAPTEMPGSAPIPPPPSEPR